MPRLDVYEFMLDYQERWGFPPTLDEVARYAGYAHRSGARRAMQALLRKGLVTEVKGPLRARRYEATTHEHPTVDP